MLTDAADSEMFDHDEEDKDLGSQVGKESIATKSTGSESKESTSEGQAGSKATSTVDTLSHQQHTPEPIESTAVPEKLFSPQTQGALNQGAEADKEQTGKDSEGSHGSEASSK